MKKRKTGLIFQIFSYVQAITLFFITYYFDMWNYNNNVPISAVPSFLLSMISLMITHIIYINSKTEKVSVDYENIHEAVKNYLHITKLGTPKYAWSYIIGRLPSLESVQNTSFNFQDEYEQTNERLYSSEDYEESLKIIANHINKGLYWKDIGDTSALTRFKYIRSILKTKYIKNYSYKLITQNEPQIGFIILTYKDGSSEVLFNWDFRDIPKDPVVLISRDEEILNMFSAQYKGLWRSSVNNI